VPLRILGEDLVLFRDDQERLGLLGLHCAHRGADLSYGRCEDGGLRCLYHGWLFDGASRCLEQPGEPAGSTFHQRIHQPAYRCQEVAGLVFAYLGPGEPPLLPSLAAWAAPPERRFFRRYFQECNYLQGNEGNLDPPHQSFLHRKLRPGGADGRGDGTRVIGTDVRNLTLYREDVCPTIEVEPTDYGLRIFVSRRAPQGGRFVRVLNFVMPSIAIVPGLAGAEGYTMNWHVPIDDTTHWKWQLTYWHSPPPGLEEARRQHELETTADGRMVRNARNRYLQDRGDLQTGWYAGMGPFFAVHDANATESQGAIQNRTQEQLGSGDEAIAVTRQIMLRALDELSAGTDPLGVIRDPARSWASQMGVTTALVPKSEDWDAWKARHRGAEPVLRART
jgi:nitrite reductase/ring-hydroxylating ferredoxin subunit